MADLEAVLADVSYLMAMEKSKSTPAARASKKIILPDPRYVCLQIMKALPCKTSSETCPDVCNFHSLLAHYHRQKHNMKSGPFSIMFIQIIHFSHFTKPGVINFFSVRSVMHKHLDKMGEVTFDKIFNQKLGECPMAM